MIDNSHWDMTIFLIEQAYLKKQLKAFLREREEKYDEEGI